MGFESFRVELRGGPATHATANQCLRRHPHAKPDPDALTTRGSTHYTVDDGAHVIEVEVADSPVRVSCRFTLCHPPSVDLAFLGFVRELAEHLGMDLWIRDDADESNGFTLARYEDFEVAARKVIAVRRSEWVANFGPTQLRATTPEVYEKLILPRCAEPVA